MAKTLLEIAEEERRRRAMEDFARSSTPLTEPAGGVSVNDENLQRFVQGVNTFDGDIAAMAAGARNATGFGFMENLDAAVLGGLLGGTPEGTHGVDLFNYDAPTGERYAGMRDQTRDEMTAYREESPAAFTTGEIVGGVTTALPFAPRPPPTTAMRDIMRQMAIFGGTEGALFGAGMGDGETFGDVATDAAYGAGIGATLGAASVPVVAGAQRLLADPIGGAIGALRGVGNPARAGRVVSRAFNRANMTPDDVLTRIQEAAADGQGMFRTADALGLPGQRQLAGINRSPGDASTIISQWLDERQMGQNERVSSFLADAIGTDQTAQARQLALQAERRADAGLNYGDARMDAGPVNVSPAIDIIDQRIGQLNIPGMEETVNMSPLDRTLQQLRARLAVPAERLPEGVTNATLSDFGRVFEIKREIDGAIGAATRAGDGFQVQMLTTLRNSLDDALADASLPYAGARDTYRQQSQVIDAVQTGREMAAPKVRTDDALDTFNRLAPQQTPNPNNVPAPGAMSTPNPQDGFRVGYVDPILARVENMTPTSNSARLMMTPKTQEVLGAISTDPDLLARRVNREMDMFQTRNMAMGGSPTANILEDIADVADTAPNLAQVAMNPTTSIINALGTKAGQFMQGTNEQTRQLIARVLLSADPQKELEPLLRAAMMSQTGNRAAEGTLRQLGYNYDGFLPNQ
jgi:hypothetical protein